MRLFFESRAFHDKESALDSTLAATQTALEAGKARAADLDFDAINLDVLLDTDVWHHFVK